MTFILTFFADFAIALFSIISGLAGVFLFLLTVLTRCMGRKHKPFTSNILVFGSIGVLIIWLWIQIGLTIGDALPNG